MSQFHAISGRCWPSSPAVMCSLHTVARRASDDRPASTQLRGLLLRALAELRGDSPVARNFPARSHTARPLGRTRLVLPALLVAGATLLAGCAAEPEPRQPTASPKPPAATPTPKPEPVQPDPQANADLAAAVAADDGDGVRSAIERGADLELRGEAGRTPLVAATKANAVAAATALIEAGADVNAKDDIEDSAYLYAGAEGDRKSVV